ncbi:phage tail tape measure protein [Streptococcus dysgalactiae]|uniref:phage tail tape measure protein n=1 Tax=Streptococcus dysgalactiae TaxID=1334 RepID=UPI0022B6CCC1|nr:phage tail tape measure protein [Streptococcus dysgalactiae]
MEIFKLFGSIGLKNKEANQAIDETTGKAEESSGKIASTFKKLAGILGTLFAGKVLFDFGKSVVEAAATAKAIDSQFSQVFGDIEKTAQDKLNAVAKEVGALPNRIKPAFNQIASFAKVTGMSAEESLDFTARATAAAADSAAFYDKSLEETTDTLKSYLKGNYEVADNLGILSTETTRNAAATEMFGSKFKDLSGLQQQQVLLKMYEDANKVSGAMGQAARESDGFENVMGNLKQAWTDFKVLVGGPLLQPVVGMLKIATSGFQFLGDKFKEIEPKIRLFQETVVSVYDVIFGSQSKKDNVDLLVKLGMDQGTAQKLMDASEQIGAIITSFWDVIFGSQSKKDNVDFMTSLGIDKETANSVVEFAESIRVAFENIGGIISGLSDIVGQFISSLFDVSSSKENINEVSSVFESLGQLIEDITGYAKGFVDWFKDGGTSVDIFKSAIAGLTGVWVGYKIVVGIINGIEAARNLILGISNGLMIARFVQTGALTAAEGAHAAATVAGTGAMAAFNAVMAVNPIMLVVLAIAALVAGLVWFFTQTETGKKIWQDFTSWLGSTWNSLSESGKQIFDSIGKFISNTWNNIKSETSRVWDGIKTTISEKIEAAKNVVKSTIDKIKNLFNFKWSLPPIKLPHFKVSGGKAPWGFMGKGSLPSVGVEWYAKGGIMTAPTLFGMNGNNAMVGGEAGPEAVLPLNKNTLGQIGEGIRSATDSDLGTSVIVELLTEVIDLLGLLVDKDTDFYLDGDSIVAKTWSKTRDKIELATSRNRRLRGDVNV